MSLVVDILFEKFGTKYNVGIAFLYSGTEDERRPEQLLQKLFHQLGRRMPVLPAAVEEIYSQCEAKTLRATVAELLGAITVMCTSLSKVYFVFDAIDFWTISDSQVLFSGLLGFQEVRSVNVFAASCTHRYIGNALRILEQYPILERDKTAVTSDMAVYVAHTMCTLRRRLFEGQESRIVVEKAIMKRSGPFSV